MNKKMSLDESSLLATSKRGFTLATLAGLLGGPLGVIASPLTLVIVNLIFRGKGKSANRFRKWAYAGILIAPISLLASIMVLIGIGVILDDSFTGPSDSLVPSDQPNSK